MTLELSMPSDIEVHANTDAILVVDATETFMKRGGLPVPGGDEIVEVVKELIRPPVPSSDLRPLFDQERCIATIDKHFDHVSFASSFIGAKQYDKLVIQKRQKWVPCVDLEATPSRITSEHLVVVRGPKKRRYRVKIAPHAKFNEEELRAYLHKVGEQILWPDHGVAGTDEAELHPELRDPSYFGYVLVKGLDPCCDSYSAFKDNRGRPTELAGILRCRGVKRVFVCGLALDFCVGWTALDARALGFEAVVLEDATRAVNIPGTKKKPGSVETIRRRFKEAGVVISRTTDLVAA